MKKLAIAVALVLILLSAIYFFIFKQVSQVSEKISTGAKTTQKSIEIKKSIGDDYEAIVREKVKAMSVGKILFNPPEEMTVAEEVHVEVRITKDLAADLSTGLRGPGKPISEEIKVNTFMKVTLDGGEKFQIAPRSSPEQLLPDLPDLKFTQWEWDVTPKNSGLHSLVLSVTAVIKISNRPDVYYDLPVLKREIHVKINPVHTTRSFIGKYWQWIIGTIIIPLMAWLYNRRRKT